MTRRPARLPLAWIPLIASLFLAACSGANPTAAPATATVVTGPPQRGLAVVEQVTVAPLAVQSAQAQVTVRGTLGDACTELADIATERNGQTFVVTVATTRPAGAACAAVAAPFERQVSLDVAGLPNGDYLVVVNGLSTTLNLAGAPGGPAPTATPATSAAATPTQAAPSPTPEPPAAPATAPAPTAVPTSAPAAAQPANCVDKAAFDSDVTVPDHTVFDPGEKFQKTWRVQNAGTCAWQGYTLVFDSGDKMSAPLSTALPTVKPNEYVEITVDMAAPADGGSHIGRWMFQNSAGQRFGLSVPATGALWVWIDVSWGAGGASAGATASGGSGGGSGGGACGTTRNTAGEAQLLSQINGARAQNGLAPLNVNPALSEAAWRHAQDMACNGINSINPHRGSDGTTFQERISQSGYGGNARSSRENVYYGGTPADAFDWWMNSQIHHDNILFPTATDIGVAYAVSASAEWTNYYTLVFGQP